MILAASKVDTITGISSMAMRHVLDDVLAAYTQESGRAVTALSVGGIDAARRVEQGEAFDFVVLAADAIEKLAASGHVGAGTRTDLARSGVAVAVAAGAPRPDIGTASAVRDAVLRAGSVGYSTGPSGAHLVALFERWNIAEAIAPRVVLAPPGTPVGALVAQGKVELGFQQFSELMHLPGIDVIGPLPAEVQVVTVFSAAVCSLSSQPEATRALLAFLASSQADAIKRRHGMEPA